jgi:hypothetical protein
MRAVSGQRGGPGVQIAVHLRGKIVVEKKQARLVELRLSN